MIDTIIFDIGNVLKKFEKEEYLKELFSDEETRRHVNDAIWGNGNWQLMDIGESADRALSLMISAEPKYENEIRLTFETIGKCMFKQDYAIPWIKELKSRGYKVLYLSNYSKYVMDICPEVLDFLPYMDGGIFSCDVRVMKPDEKIYRLLMDRYSLTANECVFIDDNLANVETAKSLGMAAIHFVDYDQARSQLEDIIFLQV